MSESSNRKTVAERIFEGIVYDPSTGCALWCGGTGGGGYGAFKVNGRKRLIHRLAWELARGPIPDGMVIDHRCRTLRCCRVEHLRVVTRRINSIENSNSQSAVNFAKDGCPKCGGEYTTDNEGRRRCLPCKSAYNAKHRALRTAAADALGRRDEGEECGP